MKGKKILFLFLALLLPVFVFLFLKFFGKNQFDVPPLYQEKTEFPGQCGINYSFPYFLPDAVMDRIMGAKKASLYVVNFSSVEGGLNRIHEAFHHNEVILIQSSSFNLENSEAEFFRNCLLLLKSPADVVLIDNLKRIRGYYQAADRDEIDRMLVEIKIILKKY